MAATNLDLDGIVEAVEISVNQDPDTLSSSDDEYTIIKRLANKAINRWERDSGVLWNELWQNTTVEGTGATLVIADGTSTYAAPTAFARPGGWVKLVSGNQEVRLPVLKPHEAQKASVGSETDFAYFTGNPGSGFTLNINPTPSANYDGYTIKYDYYKLATALSTGTDKPEMRDPWFIVDYVSSEMVREEDPTRWQTFRQDAEEKLKEMEIDNMQYAPYQNYENEDAHAIALGFVLGA